MNPANKPLVWVQWTAFLTEWGFLARTRLSLASSRYWKNTIWRNCEPWKGMKRKPIAPVHQLDVSCYCSTCLLSFGCSYMLSSQHTGNVRNGHRGRNNGPCLYCELLNTAAVFLSRGIDCIVHRLLIARRWYAKMLQWVTFSYAWGGTVANTVSYASSALECHKNIASLGVCYQSGWLVSVFKNGSLIWISYQDPL